MTSSPRPAAPVTYSVVSFGVRCAERTRLSQATPNLPSVSATFFMTSQSDLDPMRMPTSGLSVVVAVIASFPLAEREAPLAVEIGEVLRLDELEVRAGDPVEQREDVGLPHDAAAHGEEAAAALVSAEGLRRSIRPDLDAAR